MVPGYHLSPLLGCCWARWFLPYSLLQPLQLGRALTPSSDPAVPSEAASPAGARIDRAHENVPGPHLQARVGVKLIEEVHEEINLEGADTKDDVFLRLGPVAAVIATRLLPLHPQVDELLELQTKAES